MLTVTDDALDASVSSALAGALAEAALTDVGIHPGPSGRPYPSHPTEVGFVRVEEPATFACGEAGVVGWWAWPRRQGAAVPPPPSVGPCPVHGPESWIPREETA